MGGVQSRPETFFRVSPVEPGGTQCFAIGQDDVAKSRCDVDFHHPSYASLIRQIETLPDTALISEIIASPLISGFAAGKENRAQSGEESAPQIRPTQILPDGEIDLSDAYGIGYENISERDYLQSGEVLFNNTNSTSLVGKSAVFREPVAAVCSNHVTRLRLKDGIEPEFVEMVLNMLQQQGYFARLCTNFNNQAGVNTTTLADVRIPFPSAEQRESLVADMLAARAERRTKLAEADAILAGIDDFMLDALGIAPPAEDTRRVFAVRRGDIGDLSISPPAYVPELQHYLNGLRNHSAATEPLSEYVEVNPRLDISGLDADTIVGFIPMPAVADGATGEYTVTPRRLDEVRKGYTSFADGDILWAKITPCMQNGKSCLVDDLPNGLGFGSTEFHVLRVRAAGISAEFVREFVSQATLRRIAAYTFTGSAGQQRVPASFLENLPFPELSIERQNEIAGTIGKLRSKVLSLRAEAETGWEEAKEWFAGQVLETPTR